MVFGGMRNENQCGWAINFEPLKKFPPLIPQQRKAGLTLQYISIVTNFKNQQKIF